MPLVIESSAFNHHQATNTGLYKNARNLFFEPNKINEKSSGPQILFQIFAYDGDANIPVTGLGLSKPIVYDVLILHDKVPK